MVSSNFPNQGTVYLEGNPVKQVSLLTGAATPQNSPKVINGEVREQIILCDPLTGAPLDLQSGGSGTVKSVNAQSPDGSGNVELSSANLSDYVSSAWATCTVNPDGVTAIAPDYRNGSNQYVTPINNTQTFNVPLNLPDGKLMKFAIIGSAGQFTAAWVAYSQSTPNVPGYRSVLGSFSAPASPADILFVYVERRGNIYDVTPAGTTILV